MKATAELPSRAEKAEPDIVFSCICSNAFMILIYGFMILDYGFGTMTATTSFNLILPYM